MSGEVDTYGLGPALADATQTLAATRHVADRIASEHPHPLEDTMPRLAGRLTGQDPDIAAGLRELLEALGLPTTTHQLRAVKARARTEQHHKEAS